MSVATAKLRTKLNELWKKVLSKELESLLLADNEVPSEFLELNDIKIIRHCFENQHDNLALEPPVLFDHYPLFQLQLYPIDPAGFGDSEDAEEELEFREYNPPATLTDEENYRWGPEVCAGLVQNYLVKWALGGFPRKNLPAVSLLDLSSLTPVSLPNPLLLGPGFERTGHPPCRDWDAGDILEYNESGTPFHSHVILIVQQSCNAQDGSIILGELAPLITAMRNRALQPTAEEDGDGGEHEEDSAQEEEEEEEWSDQDPTGKTGPPFQFPTEERFPVLMISLVGPQMGRVLYASMDGSNLVIRQSGLYSFQSKDVAPWDFFTTLLLSSPLEEKKGKSSD